jgi:hypothetical protein
MVLLLHYVVKKYDGTLGLHPWVENTSDAKRFAIEELLTSPNIALNAYIIAKRAVEEIEKIIK